MVANYEYQKNEPTKINKELSNVNGNHGFFSSSAILPSRLLNQSNNKINNNSNSKNNNSNVNNNNNNNNNESDENENTIIKRKKSLRIAPTLSSLLSIKKRPKYDSDDDSDQDSDEDYNFVDYTKDPESSNEEDEINESGSSKLLHYLCNPKTNKKTNNDNNDNNKINSTPKKVDDNEINENIETDLDNNSIKSVESKPRAIRLEVDLRLNGIVINFQESYQSINNNNSSSNNDNSNKSLISLNNNNFVRSFKHETISDITFNERKNVLGMVLKKIGGSKNNHNNSNEEEDFYYYYNDRNKDGNGDDEDDDDYGVDEDDYENSTGGEDIDSDCESYDIDDPFIDDSLLVKNQVIAPCNGNGGDQDNDDMKRLETNGFYVIKNGIDLNNNSNNSNNNNYKNYNNNNNSTGGVTIQKKRKLEEEDHDDEDISNENYETESDVQVPSKIDKKLKTAQTPKKTLTTITATTKSIATIDNYQDNKKINNNNNTTSQMIDQKNSNTKTQRKRKFDGCDSTTTRKKI
ncbi:hypothetical protein ACTFIU_003699 [Dictyostelium citrinum]